MLSRRVFRFCLSFVRAALPLALLATVVGCGGVGGSSIPPPPAITISLSAATVTLPQDGTPVTVTVTVGNAPATAAVLTQYLPTGVTAKFTPTGSGPSGTLQLTGGAAVAAGTTAANVVVKSGESIASAGLQVISAPVATVSAAQDTTLGIHGVLSQFMATSFQVASYADGYFLTNATSRESTLAALGAQHTRLQVVGDGTPMVGNTGTSADWSFAVIDSLTQPVLGIGDNSPEMQLGTAPTWMNDSAGHLDTVHHLDDFATYSANVVRYYNTGGFNWGGQHFQSPSAHPIHWWGIFNEYNGNGLNATQYVTLYNKVTAAMLAADPTVEFSAQELSDYGLGTGDGGDPKVFLPPFFAPAASGGVSEPVSVVSTHFYSTCNQKDLDQALLSAVPGFAQNIEYFRQEAALRPDLGKIQVWVTGNNVNADWSNNGVSACNPPQAFVDDPRGTSAFFAAWRPYVFSQLGKAGNQALYHWAYAADPQYGEVNSSTGNTYLSYWVDEALAAIYPAPPGSPGQQILQLSATETSDIELLATRNADNSVVIMVDNHAIANPSADNNGTGAPRTVVLDLSTLGSFTSASQLAFDAGSSATTAPAWSGVTPAARVNVTLPGYGVTFLKLVP